jgi:hypothetical protein
MSHDAWVGYPNGFDSDQIEAYLTNDGTDAEAFAELERTGRVAQ